MSGACYVVIYQDPDGTPRYVGKGVDGAARLNAGEQAAQPAAFRAWLAAQEAPLVCSVAGHHLTEAEARALERDLVAKHTKTLFNVRPGGEAFMHDGGAALARARAAATNAQRSLTAKMTWSDPTRRAAAAERARAHWAARKQP